MDIGQRLSKEDSPTTVEEKKKMAAYPYRELVGSLMYLAQCTRPDLAYATAKLGQFSSNPGMPHWIAAKSAEISKRNARLQALFQEKQEAANCIL
jgi:hypothetical protein